MEKNKKENSADLKGEKKIENILFNSFKKSNQLPELKKTEKEIQFIVDWQLFY